MHILIMHVIQEAAYIMTLYSCCLKHAKCFIIIGKIYTQKIYAIHKIGANFSKYSGKYSLPGKFICLKLEIDSS